MASFFNNPMNSQYLGTLGLGLLQAAQPQPYGQNRMSYLSNAFASANENLLKSQLMEKRLEELDTRINRYKGLEKERESRQSAVSKLMGGYDPQTDINWETGRAGMGEGEQMSTLAQAAPDQFAQGMIGKMFAEPAGPQSPLGKLRNDYMTGKITKDEYEAALRKQTYIRPSDSVSVNNILGGKPLVETPEMISKGEFFKRDKDRNIVLDEQGLPIIETAKGGKTQRELEEEARKVEGRKEQQERYGGIAVEDAKEAIRKLETSSIPLAGFASIANYIPGTPQHDLWNLIESVKANAGFDRLQIMRQNSPTGGSLGNVSNFEVETLQSTLGSLRQSQSKEQLVRNLKRVMAIYTGIIDGVEDENGNLIDPLENPLEWEEQATKNAGPAPANVRTYNPETGEFE